MSVGIPDLSVGRLDANVNKGCTVTAQPRHRVGARVSSLGEFRAG